jgi:hypothetical protein
MVMASSARKPPQRAALCVTFFDVHDNMTQGLRLDPSHGRPRACG